MTTTNRPINPLDITMALQLAFTAQMMALWYRAGSFFLFLPYRSGPPRTAWLTQALRAEA